MTGPTLRLLSLDLRDWRNVAETRLVSDARFVVLHGDNGQGKTNVLEAVWLLAALRSFRENRPSRLLRHGAAEACVEGRVSTPGGVRHLEWRRTADARVLLLDGGPTADLEAWFGVLRAVLFCPEHLAIVRGGPEDRRRFLDRAAFTARPAHLSVVRDYLRVVRQKTALLRDGGGGRSVDAQLDAWNERLIRLGSELVVRRRQAVQELRQPFQELHEQVAGSRGVELHLRGHGAEAGDPEAVVRSLTEAVEAARAEELRTGRVLAGPHRDDLDIRLGGRLARTYASQGQARSLVLSLKLAELEAARRRGDVPLFLLDDLTSELDRGRMERLVAILGGLANQVWVTTTDPAHLGPLPPSDTVRWRMVSGRAEST